jgi:hypothetical protein
MLAELSAFAPLHAIYKSLGKARTFRSSEDDTQDNRPHKSITVPQGAN